MSDEKEELTHIQISVKDKKKIDAIKKKTGYGSARVVIHKLLEKCAGKVT